MAPTKKNVARRHRSFVQAPERCQVSAQSQNLQRSDPPRVSINNIHQALDYMTAEFRLVEFLPGTLVNDAEEIQLTLTHTSLDENHDYKAVSYEWGPPLPVHDIKVNGRCMTIRQNLYNFLKTLRRHYEHNKGTRFWIDQICVDQTNIAERNHQVAQMASIYRKADEVLVWLGVASSQNELHAHQLEILSKPIENPHRVDMGGMVLDHGHMDTITPRDVFDILCNLPYWKRMWIIQELLLARSILVFWGQTVIEWPKLCNFLASVKGSGKESLNTLLRLRDFRDRRGVDGLYRLTWAEALYCSLDSHCEISHDKVFGLLGLVSPSITFQPDYLRPTHLVVEDLLLREPRVNPYLGHDDEEFRALGSAWSNRLGLPELTVSEELMERARENSREYRRDPSITDTVVEVRNFDPLLGSFRPLIARLKKLV